MQPLDLTGKQFGKLTVIERSETDKVGTYWLCRCECGDTKVVKGTSLTRDKGTKSCGCLSREVSAKRVKGLIDQKFGKLTAIEASHKNTRGTFWKCVCDCGTEKVIRGAHLIAGAVQSCGCSYEEYWRTLQKPDSCYQALFRTYRRGATIRGYDFDLEFEQFKELILKPCVYCGAELSNSYSYRQQVFRYNGVDRQDNDIGYNIANCVPCCCVCNRAKGTLTYDEFKTWIKQTHNFMENMSANT